MPLGPVPEGCSSYNFLKQMGKTQANILLAGERLCAQEAYVGRLITTEVQAPTVEESLVKIGGYSAEVLQMAKQLTMDAMHDVEARKRADVLVIFEGGDAG